ncbi:MAG: hypothetical protein EA402_01915 [Planctomycetota bacterium]|nr:MAG: hypothetical protein EA402_01915 [Planctomycetota bacterium]
MAFKDWTRFFRRSETDLQPLASDQDAAGAETPRSSAGEPDREQQLSRTALMKELEQGFHQVGRVVERFDEHLGTTNRLMESVAAEQERLPALITELTAAASASRHAHEAVAQTLSSRDEANQKLLAHLGTLSDSFELERDQHRAQLALVLRLQRGSRRVLILLLLFSFLLISILLMLVLILALRPDLIGSDRIANPWLTSSNAAQVEVQPLNSSIRAAAMSPEPAIQATAKELLEQTSPEAAE